MQHLTARDVPHDDDMVVETTTATDVASIDDPADTAGEE